MKLTAYVLDGHTLDIRPAPRERDWMDATDQHYAYRCLPLAIANAHGWELLCQGGFLADWNGGNGMDDIRIHPLGDGPVPAVSHFGYGVLTFHVPCLFRTDAGIDLLVTGPQNRPKDGIAGLSGIVETDWSPYTFTMNWRFTRPGRVRFDAGEPFCHLMPLQRSLTEDVQAEWRPIAEAPELERLHHEWTQSRGRFLQELGNPASEAWQQKWQRGYFRGETGDGHGSAPGHRSKLRLPMLERGDEPEAST
jgi:hypothetical protein